MNNAKCFIKWPNIVVLYYFKRCVITYVNFIIGYWIHYFADRLGKLQHLLGHEQIQRTTKRERFIGFGCAAVVTKSVLLVYSLLTAIEISKKTIALIA